MKVKHAISGLLVVGAATALLCTRNQDDGDRGEDNDAVAEEDESSSDPPPLERPRDHQAAPPTGFRSVPEFIVEVADPDEEADPPAAKREPRPPNLFQEAFLATFGAFVPGIMKCLSENTPPTDDDEPISVVIRVTVDADENETRGQVTAVEFETPEDTEANQPGAQALPCVEKLLTPDPRLADTPKLPKPEDGAVTVRFPFQFQPTPPQ